MKRIALLLLIVAMISGVVTASAKTSTPSNKPPAKLIVDPPVPELLAQGVVWITWRAENVNIGPESGKDHLDASPRVGHLHIHVALLPAGPHKIRIELVSAIHQGVPEQQSKTVTFTIPEGAHPH
jgi:hypothetical protein